MIIDPFHRSLNELINQQIVKNSDALASGSALSFDEYKRQVGYIRALHDVLDWCEALEAEKYGKKRTQDDL